jgi:hypothetical protein
MRTHKPIKLGKFCLADDGTTSAAVRFPALIDSGLWVRLGHFFATSRCNTRHRDIAGFVELAKGFFQDFHTAPSPKSQVVALWRA